MKAIVIREFGPTEVMRLEEVPDPRPQAGEVLVRVHAIGVNPVDAYRRSGRYRALPALPYTPGSDAAGEVVALGPGVERWRVGDRVYTDHRAAGAYAEYVCCHEDRLHPIPDGVGYPAAAALGVPYATAYRALFQRGQARAGERLLVHGATGGVGLAAVQLAASAGLEVTGTGGTTEGRDEVIEQGAARALDHHAPDHAERLAEAAPGGFDVILEMLANRNLAIDLRVLAPRGRVVVVGSRGEVEIDPRDLMSRETEVRGMTLANTPDDDLRSIHEALFAGLQEGTLRPVVAEELPLADAPAAHELVMRDGHRGKIVLIP
ncbi:MAG TPA: NADPH:quinone reductase [Longimicrobiaceae bacterium]